MTSQLPAIAGPTLPNILPEWDRVRADLGRRLGPSPLPDPLYCLAEPIIARLERPHLGRPPLLAPPAAEAERALIRFCRRSFAVGFLDRSPVVYPDLAPPLPPPPAAEMTDAGWSPELRREIEAMARQAVDTSVRLKGYAGWLLTEPAFLEQCRDLAGRWAASPPGERPRFPLRRGSFDPGLPDEVRAAAAGAGAAFGGDFVRFCEHWGLLGMASWDLPEPQGAVFPNLLPPGAPSMPRQGLHIYLPIHYPLTGDDELLARILREQRLAVEAGLSPTAAGLPHHRAYATILEVLHWERAITTRFAAARTPRGFIGLIQEAIAAALELSVDQVNKSAQGHLGLPPGAARLASGTADQDLIADGGRLP